MIADEFIKNYGCNSRKDIRECMIEFAQYHVEQALKEASEKAEIILHCDMPETEHINIESILTAYPKENIK